jgi:hypothetical protein
MTYSVYNNLYVDTSELSCPIAVLHSDWLAAEERTMGHAYPAPASFTAPAAMADSYTSWTPYAGNTEAVFVKDGYLFWHARKDLGLGDGTEDYLFRKLLTGGTEEHVKLINDDWEWYDAPVFILVSADKFVITSCGAVNDGDDYDDWFMRWREYSFSDPDNSRTIGDAPYYNSAWSAIFWWDTVLMPSGKLVTLARSALGSPTYLNYHLVKIFDYTAGTLLLDWNSGTHDSDALIQWKVSPPVIIDEKVYITAWMPSDDPEGTAIMFIIDTASNTVDDYLFFCPKDPGETTRLGFTWCGLGQYDADLNRIVFRVVYYKGSISGFRYGILLVDPSNPVSYSVIGESASNLYHSVIMGASKTYILEIPLAGTTIEIYATSDLGTCLLSAPKSTLTRVNHEIMPVNCVCGIVDSNNRLWCVDQSTHSLKGYSLSGGETITVSASIPEPASTSTYKKQFVHLVDQRIIIVNHDPGNSAYNALLTIDLA